MTDSARLRGIQKKEWATFAIAALSLIISIRACSLSKESNEISMRFSEINAEVQWNNLLTLYNEVDDQIREWEVSKGLKRDGRAIENQKQLEKYLKTLSQTGKKPPPDIVRCYKLRFERYESLKIVAQRYDAVKERLHNIDFVMPSPPRRSSGGSLSLGLGLGL